MKHMRIFGDNVAFLLRGRDKGEFESALGFSANDVARIKEGRIILRHRDISDIADYLGVTQEELFKRHPERRQVHVLGECDGEGLDAILDLIDIYCDIVEAVENGHAV